MPELAEVELARRIWEPGSGQKIILLESHPKTRVYRDTAAQEIQVNLVGKAMVASHTHGKRLIFGFAERSNAASVIYLELHLGTVSYTHLTLPTNREV